MIDLSDQKKEMLISYMGLRTAIGVIGIALPFVLALGFMLLEGFQIRSSISSYYHTAVGDIFVGSLCAIAVFMLSYRGYEPKDNIVGHLACVFAIGVALFPTTPDGIITDTDKILGMLHYISAGLLFATLAYFALFLFTKTHENGEMTPEKKKRNKVYRACGFTIIACIILIGIVALFPDTSRIHKLSPVFWLESAAIVAFGISWLIKGEAILGDKNRSNSG